MEAILRGRHRAIQAEHHRNRMVAYELATWVAFAFHDPRGMPAFKALAEARAGAAIDDAKVRGWFIARSMREH